MLQEFAWSLFEETGEIKAYLLYKEFSGTEEKNLCHSECNEESRGELCHSESSVCH